MKERTLLKIALSCTIIGIISLLILSETIDTDFYTINQIKELDDQTVRTNGKITNIQNKANITIITLERKETIDIVFFQNINLTADQNIEIIGKISEYEGNKQIIADKIFT